MLTWIAFAKQWEKKLNLGKLLYRGVGFLFQKEEVLSVELDILTAEIPSNADQAALKIDKLTSALSDLKKPRAALGLRR